MHNFSHFFFYQSYGLVGNLEDRFSYDIWLNCQFCIVKPVLSDHIKQDIFGFSDRWLLIAA